MYMMREKIIAAHLAMSLGRVASWWVSEMMMLIDGCLKFWRRGCVHQQ
jgi:hypothetical protein